MEYDIPCKDCKHIYIEEMRRIQVMEHAPIVRTHKVCFGLDLLLLSWILLWEEWLWASLALGWVLFCCVGFWTGSALDWVSFGLGWLFAGLGFC